MSVSVGITAKAANPVVDIASLIGLSFELFGIELVYWLAILFTASDRPHFVDLFCGTNKGWPL